MKRPDKTGLWHERGGQAFYVDAEAGIAREVETGESHLIADLPDSDYLEAQRPDFTPPPRRPQPKIVYARLLNANPDTLAQWVAFWPEGNQPANTGNPQWYELVSHREQDSEDARYFLDRGAKLA